ncbi:MAG: pyruvate ferredoxin oxidoreductase [Candidatus Margulisbacteria bacterium]|nr:pyruvate ferredoxin oxidoreductase [Candidatus Margulisiibacteriota bacterium]MBU1021396.1 pyruvate ferredoxin oxidoreductase [Candidatus Margulisiibacteriota bacterium]MBU1729115.1 pyruvate ferredoxin oxidoreductase [Candidatus Margulisiibacteriota bacterium]MBU1954788.1 pyruvate ferredoxin oxidoreductase [Candidatus Margulisiibacteriota bacterium]
MPAIARTGNEAMAEAMRQINPDVVAAYPITPATEIAQIFANFEANGDVDTEYVRVESEHSAMSATVAAAAAGGRAMTATSSQGLALMGEILPIASALRLPIVMPEVNRALSGPINIHCDHSDTMMNRDAGWIQIFSENAQEAYDNVLQAIRIAEHDDVLLPAMVTTDGFIISHCMEKIETMEDSDAKAFIGEYKPKNPLLDYKNPLTLGALDLQDYYFEHKRPIAEAMHKSKNVILEVGKEFEKKTGRSYGFFEEVSMEDAEIAIIALGSTAGTARMTVKNLREKGIKAGLIKLRVFRPFPEAELVNALKKLKVLAVLDRSDGYAATGGPLFSEIRSALYDLKTKPMVVNYVYGLGGREMNFELLDEIYADLQKIAKDGKVDQLVKYSGLRE